MTHLEQNLIALECSLCKEYILIDKTLYKYSLVCPFCQATGVSQRIHETNINYSPGDKIRINDMTILVVTQIMD